MKKLVAACTALLAVSGAGAHAADSDLAQQLSNPVADLISVPFQLNYDQDIGPNDDTDRWTLNIQPVIPISINENWNLISRTIVPVIGTNGPGTDAFGVGDIVQSAFFSPKEPTAGGWTWGAGPVFLIPSGDDDFSAKTFGIGPTAVALKVQGPWTYGGLANHIWSVGGQDISSTFLQPFVAYTTPSAYTFSLNSESTYDWENDQWSVPINAIASKVLTIGKQPVSVGIGARYWAESAPGGPEGLGARLLFTMIFPKG